MSECGQWSFPEENNEVVSTYWPSLALLFHVKMKISCTATIISPTTLLTAYSCLQPANFNPLEWVVFAGSRGDMPMMDEATQIKIVKDIVNHPQTKQHQHLVAQDITLVTLYEPLHLNSNVKAACLSDSTPKQRLACYEVGWAVTSIGKNDN